MNADNSAGRADGGIRDAIRSALARGITRRRLMLLLLYADKLSDAEIASVLGKGATAESVGADIRAEIERIRREIFAAAGCGLARLAPPGAHERPAENRVCQGCPRQSGCRDAARWTLKRAGLEPA